LLASCRSRVTSWMAKRPSTSSDSRLTAWDAIDEAWLHIRSPASTICKSLLCRKALPNVYCCFLKNEP
jgi:hypothetical protein